MSPDVMDTVAALHQQLKRADDALATAEHMISNFQVRERGCGATSPHRPCPRAAVGSTYADWLWVWPITR